MPELPEVETLRRGLEAAFVGKKLREVIVRRSSLRWPIPVPEILAERGQVLRAVSRRSKYLCLELGGRTGFLIHLGMSGRLLERGRRGPKSWERHEHWRMRFDAQWLGYVDPRRFGALLTCPLDGLGSHELLARLGPDANSRALSARQLHAESRGRRVPLKCFLMDAKNVAGIGNIYASEICFDAGQRPGKAVGRLSLAAFERIVHSTRRVMSRAIRFGGTSLRDYRTTTGQKGTQQETLFVYGREGLPCRICRTPVRCLCLQSRSTYYCPQCQK